MITKFSKILFVFVFVNLIFCPVFVSAETSFKEWEEEDNNLEQPVITLKLKLGETVSKNVKKTVIEGDVKEDSNDEIYDYTKTTITERVATAIASKLNVKVIENYSELKSVRPVYDANKKELYLGYFDDPDKVQVSANGPDGYDYQFVGMGDYSSQYLSYANVVYKKDENGKSLKDENGEYIIEKLVISGTTVTSGGEPTTDLNSIYDQRSYLKGAQFLLKNKDGDVAYGYCIDLATPAEDGTWYQIQNLEDNNYYASDDAEKHVRAIVMNGYWGTESDADNDGKYDVGSLALLKQKLKKALADGKIDKKITVTYRENGVIVTEDVELTNEILDNLTEGEALDMTQAAIWSYANGAQDVQDGKDGIAVGNVMYGDMAQGNSTGKNDPEGMARMSALYKWLLNLDTKAESTVVINEKNYIKGLSLSIGNRVKDDIYEASVVVDLYHDINQKDNLAIHLTYVDANGEEQTVVKRLVGELKEGEEYAEINENGIVIDGLQLKNNSDTTISLRLEGYQYLELGAYIFTSEVGVEGSQTFVSLAEGVHNININKDISLSFDVNDDNKFEEERNWKTKTYEEYPPNTGIELDERYTCQNVMFILDELLNY